MNKKHEMIEKGELYISHVEAKKRFKVSKKQLNDWSAAGQLRVIYHDIARMPHQLINDNQLELHFYHAEDIRKALEGEKK